MISLVGRKFVGSYLSTWRTQNRRFLTSKSGKIPLILPNSLKDCSKPGTETAKKQQCN